MSEKTASKLSRGRLSSLDVLRFLAAAAVMVYHFTYEYAKDSSTALPLLQAITRHGYLGVEVFFMISGFVILWSAQGRSATAFLRARILRLYPEFWIAVLLTAVIFRLAPGDFGGMPSLADILANLSMVPQAFGAPYVDGVYWTLFVEIKFYFLLWVLILLGQVPNIERWLLACIALSAVGVFLELPAALRSVLLFPYGPLFAAGGLFFLVFESGWSTLRASGLLVALPVAAALAVQGMPGFIDVPHITSAARISTVLVVACAFIFFATLRHNALGERLGRLTTVAGALTYPLYLLHNSGKAIFLRSGLGAPQPILVLGAITFSLAIAYGVMRLGTGPVQGTLKRLLDAIIARIPALQSRPTV